MVVMISEKMKKFEGICDISSRMFHEFIEALTIAVDSRDPYTALHSYRVAEITEILARKMGLEEELVLWLHIAGHLHDIGKIGITDSILLKPGKLTTEEFNEIKRHPEIGANIISNVSDLKPIVEVILQHHESWNGSGYPRGLKGEEISQGARIVHVADSMDAMLSKRPYRDAMPLTAVLEEIHSLSSIKYDPDVVSALMSIEISDIQKLFK